MTNSDILLFVTQLCACYFGGYVWGVAAALISKLGNSA